MKKYTLFITIILIALIALNGCTHFVAYKLVDNEALPDEKEVFAQDENETALDEMFSPVSDSHKYTVETFKGEITAEDGTVLATYDYSYPVFECNEGDDDEYVASINEMFKNNILDPDVELESLSREYEDSKNYGYWYGPYDYRYGFEIHADAKGILSVTETWYIYTGGAHGMHANHSYTFDVVNGRELSLSDLLYGTEEEIVEAFAKEFMKVGDMFYSGDDPAEVVKKEFPHAEYYVDADGVTAYFQEYHVGPYSSGFVSATVSDKEMLKFDFSDTAEK